MAGADTLHASAVAIRDRGVLIRGPSGSGKSALALALIARGARLVSDDRTEIRPGLPPRLAPPDALAGLIEARGIGLIRLTWQSEVPVALIVDLGGAPLARLPERQVQCLQGCAVPLIMARGCPGLADTLSVLVRDGELVDPAEIGPGGRSVD